MEFGIIMFLNNEYIWQHGIRVTNMYLTRDSFFLLNIKVLIATRSPLLKRVTCRWITCMFVLPCVYFLSHFSSIFICIYCLFLSLFPARAFTFSDFILFTFSFCHTFVHSLSHFVADVCRIGNIALNAFQSASFPRVQQTVQLPRHIAYIYKYICSFLLYLYITKW